jgi:predicted PurR-regulated permease PerM
MTTPKQDDTTAGKWLRTGDTGMSGRQKNAGLLATLLLFGGGVFTLWEFLPALAWIVIFSIAFWPLFSRLAARWPRLRRDVLPAAFVLAIVLAFVIPVALIAVPLASDGHAAGQWLDQVQKTGMAPPSFLADLPYGTRLTSMWQARLSQPGQLSTLTTGAVKGGAGKLAASFGRETIHRLVLLGFTLLGLFFFLRDGEAVIAQLRIGSRRAFGAAGEDVGQQIISSVHGTVNGLVLVGLGEGVLLGLAYVATGVPHPTLFGLLTVILAMVPFGAAIAICSAAAVLLANGSTVDAIVIVVLGAVVTFVADHFIRPVLIGGTTRLPFFWVLLGILGGFTAWGLSGLFIGPALMAALILLWREWVGSQKGPLNPSAEAAVEVTQATERQSALPGSHG